MDGYTRLLEMMSGWVGVLQEQLKEDFDYPEIDKILRILEQTAGELEKAARMTVGLERKKEERAGGKKGMNTQSGQQVPIVCVWSARPEVKRAVNATPEEQRFALEQLEEERDALREIAEQERELRLEAEQNARRMNKRWARAYEAATRERDRNETLTEALFTVSWIALLLAMVVVWMAYK